MLISLYKDITVSASYWTEVCIRQVIFTSIPDMGTKFNGYFTQVYGLFGSSD
jgi:hypothetical protein